MDGKKSLGDVLAPACPSGESSSHHEEGVAVIPRVFAEDRDFPPGFREHVLGVMNSLPDRFVFGHSCRQGIVILLRPGGRRQDKVADALTTKRVYKKAIDTFPAVEILMKKMSGSFNKDYLREFILMLNLADSLATSDQQQDAKAA